jgi:cytochrome P450
MSRGRGRDRRVYLASHPVVFALLAATRRQPVLRLGGTVVVHGESEIRHALTRMPLDRLADGTIGAKAREHLATGVLFDQEGQDHRGARRSVADDLGAAGCARLRPVWTAVLERGVARVETGAHLDVVAVAAELAGATACSLLRVNADPCQVARAARDLAAAAVRAEMPGWAPRARLTRATAAAAQQLTELLSSSPLCIDEAGSGLAAMLAVAAVTTTVAGLPRAVAWCADEGLWDQAVDDSARAVLVDELLRVVAPVPLMSRVSAGIGVVGRSPVRAGDRLLLVTRHAMRAHSDAPDIATPAPATIVQLVFGVGPHACPGAKLAKAQLDDALRLLAPLRPVVRRARADRRAALPSWRELVITAGDPRIAGNRRTAGGLP